MTSLYITEPGVTLRKQGGVISIGRYNEVIMEMPLEKVEDVMVIDTVQVSSGLATELLVRNIPLSWMSGMGKFYGTLVNTNTVDIMKHYRQFMLLEENELYLRLAKKMVGAKAHNQITVLKRYVRDLDSQNIEKNITTMKSTASHIDLVKSHLELIGYEGYISRLYFSSLGEMVPKSFSFEKRTKQPPRDPVNSLLSFGYSMLFNEILSSVVATGLHPYVGCLHRIAKGHPALVSDLIEEWRAPIVDSMVLALLKRNSLTADMFTITDEGCYLTPDARKIFLKAYNKKLLSSNIYFDDRYTYRESIKRQCQKYASAIMQGDDAVYTPLELR